VEPEQIYARAREEGRRRLARPVVELVATALVGGFDVAFGVVAFALAAGAVSGSVRPELAHLVGALAFGIGFVFVVVGKSELFTENFLVPVAGLERRSRASWLKLAELWVGTLLVNLVGGAALAIILTSKGVLRRSSHDELVGLAERLTSHSAAAELLSAVVAGALMTLMTWFVEGAAESTGVRIAMSWIVGALIALGTFNHAIVSMIELVFGMRYGAAVSHRRPVQEPRSRGRGNLVGGLMLVTFARTAQAVGATSS